jgi:hypothetical protein
MNKPKQLSEHVNNILPALWAGGQGGHDNCPALQMLGEHI